MSYRFSARFAVTIGCAIYAATSFAEMTFSKYSFEKSEIIGVWSKDIEDPSSANAILVVTTGPRSGLWVATGKDTTKATALIASGSLDECHRYTENEKREMVQIMAPQIIQLPMYERIVKQTPNPPDSTLARLALFRLERKFVDLTGEAPWYFCDK